MNRVGKFLITRPTVELGFFKRQVIFIYEDTPEGTAGLCLTYPTTLCLSDLALQKETGYPRGIHLLYKGGPIAQSSVTMVHTDDFVSSNTLHIGKGIDVSSDDVMITKLIGGNEPKKFRLVAGCCVWRPGQLDNEVEKDFWLVSNLRQDIVFNLDGELQWKAAIEHVSSEMVAQYF